MEKIGNRGPQNHKLSRKVSNFIANAPKIGPNTEGAFSTSEHFLNTLENWNTAIPFKFHWILNFHSPTFPGPHGVAQTTDDLRPRKMTDLAETGIHITSEREPVGYNQSNQVDAQANILTEYNMETFGCIFAQGVIVPGETHGVEMPTVQNSMGFLPGVISGNRSPMAQLTVQFRETNTSFADAVIRPWIIALSHYGLVARKGADENIKRDIEVIQLARVASGHPLIIRKRFLFHNCVPVSMDTNELVHDGSEIKIYTVPFHYTNYSVKFDSYGVKDQTVKDYFKTQLGITAEPKSRRTVTNGQFDSRESSVVPKAKKARKSRKPTPFEEFYLDKDRDSYAYEHYTGGFTFNGREDVALHFLDEYELKISRKDIHTKAKKARENRTQLSDMKFSLDTPREVYADQHLYGGYNAQTGEVDEADRFLNGTTGGAFKPRSAYSKNPRAGNKPLFGGILGGIMGSRTVSNFLGNVTNMFGDRRMDKSRRAYARAHGSGRFLAGPGISGFISGVIDRAFGNADILDGFRPTTSGMSRSDYAAIHSTDDPNVFNDNINTFNVNTSLNTSTSSFISRLLNKAFGRHSLSVKRAVIAASHIHDTIDIFRS